MGVSASHLDWTMVPYVRMSFTKHLKDGLKYIENFSDYKIHQFEQQLNNPDHVITFEDHNFKTSHDAAWHYAMDMTEKETYQAV